MSESLQEIDAVIARSDFLTRKVSELAQEPWPTQYQMLYAHMQTCDTEFDSEVEDVLIHTLNHPYIKTILQNAYLMFAKAAYEKQQQR